MKFTFIILILVISGIFLDPVKVWAQDDFSYQSYAKARLVLENSVKAFGGEKVLEKTRNFSLTIEGENKQLFQGKSPDNPHRLYDIKSKIVIETGRNRLFNDLSFESPDSDYIFRTREIIKDDKGYTVFLPQKWMTEMNSPSVQSYQNLYHFIPQNILSDVLKRASTLRWLGNDKFNGRKQDVVAFAFQNGSVVNLFFDSKTHLLTKYTRFTTRNTLGDTVSEVVFKDYKDSQGTKIPTSRISFQGGILVSDLKYRELVFNPKVSENFYDLPEGLTRLDLVEPQTKIKQIDENIYLLSNLSGGFNMLAVEFKDFVLTVEAPEGNSVNGISARALKMIKEKFPDKPVKYSVLTHHHGDHSAGIRAFVSEGATVITTQGNKDYVKSLTDIKFVFSPDLLTLKPNNLRMEFVTEGKKIISDDQNTVEIYQIGPIYHSEEMLLVYLPRQKLLFQSDLFNPIKPEISSTLDDPWHGIHRSDTLSLAEAIEKLNLDVEKIAGSHGRISTIEEFNEDVRKIKQSKDKF